MVYKIKLLVAGWTQCRFFIISLAYHKVYTYYKMFIHDKFAYKHDIVNALFT